MSERSHSPRVFITGALGYIGRRLAERYQELGSTVVGVDIRSDHERGVVAGDITQAGPWQDQMAGADVVIHTAAKVGMAGAENDYWRINCLGTRHVIDAAAMHKVGRLVHVSSIVAFGFEYPDGVDERYPLRPNGVPYVDTKIASEQAVLQADAAGEVACTVVRPGDVYGPGSQYWTVTPLRDLKARRFLLPAMGRGQLSPVFVDDLVTGVMLAAEKPEGAGQVYTLTGGQTIETRDFFTHYAKMVGRSKVSVAPTWLVTSLAATVGRILGGGQATPATVRYLARRGGYSIEKARSHLGFHPAVTVEEGMRRTSDWLQESNVLS